MIHDYSQSLRRASRKKAVAGTATKNLSLAFQHKDQILAGEQMPDPASDPSFNKYAKDADFQALLGRLAK
jgi:hypothetical protein